MRNKTRYWLQCLMACFVCALVVGTLTAKEPRSADTRIEDPVITHARAIIAAGKDFSKISQSTWKRLLTAEAYKILWKKGTERAFSGDLLNNKAEGLYVTAGCGIPVFRSSHKFKSGTGWPSYWDVYDKKNVRLKEDRAWGMSRTEVLSRCGEHLGHVFDDGPKPTGLRYCINSVALKFIPAAAVEAYLKQRGY